MAIDQVNRPGRDAATSALWVGLMAVSCALFSFAFACATPFAALAAVAGTRMNRRDALSTVVFAWTGNQAIGFLLRGYPRTWDTLGWGLAIGVAAVLATFAGDAFGRLSRQPILASLAALLAAFGFYEGTLFAATVVLPSGSSAFSARVILHIAEINLGAFIALLAVHTLVRSGLDRLAGRRTFEGTAATIAVSR